MGGFGFDYSVVVGLGYFGIDEVAEAMQGIDLGWLARLDRLLGESVYAARIHGVYGPHMAL